MIITLNCYQHSHTSDCPSCHVISFINTEDFIWQSMHQTATKMTDKVFEDEDHFDSMRHIALDMTCNVFEDEEHWDALYDISSEMANKVLD